MKIFTIQAQAATKTVRQQCTTNDFKVGWIFMKIYGGINLRNGQRNYDFRRPLFLVGLKMWLAIQKERGWDLIVQVVAIKLLLPV